MTEYQTCTHCRGPLYVDAVVQIYGPRLRLDSTWDYRDADGESDRVDRESVYCGDCETEWPSIAALADTRTVLEVAE
jgi:hypothetical protein